MNEPWSDPDADPVGDMLFWWEKIESVSGLTPPGPILTTSHPEPPVGSIVKDRGGKRWQRCLSVFGDGTYWLPADYDDHDPQSWIKIAGNYGPVVLVYIPSRTDR